MIGTFLTALALAAPQNLVVMVHGAGGGGWEYDFWKPVFEKAGWRVVAKDLLPAKGGLERTKFTDYVGQVEAWSKRPKGAKLVLVGASMGGILALKAAETLHPDALVLVDSVPPKGIGPARPQHDYPPIIKWANGPIKDTRDSMPDSDEKTIQWAWKRWRDESGGVLSTISQGVSVKPPTCPVLVIIGEKDTDVDPASGREMAKKFHGDIHFYQGMSHVGPLLSTRATEVASSAQAWVAAALRR